MSKTLSSKRSLQRQSSNHKQTALLPTMFLTLFLILCLHPCIKSQPNTDGFTQNPTTTSNPMLDSTAIPQENIIEKIPIYTKESEIQKPPRKTTTQQLLPNHQQQSLFKPQDYKDNTDDVTQFVGTDDGLADGITDFTKVQQNIENKENGLAADNTKKDISYYNVDDIQIPFLENYSNQNLPKLPNDEAQNSSTSKNAQTPIPTFVTDPAPIFSQSNQESIQDDFNDGFVDGLQNIYYQIEDYLVANSTRSMSDQELQKFYQYMQKNKEPEEIVDDDDIAFVMTPKYYSRETIAKLLEEIKEKQRIAVSEGKTPDEGWFVTEEDLFKWWDSDDIDDQWQQIIVTEEDLFKWWDSYDDIDDQWQQIIGDEGEGEEIGEQEEKEEDESVDNEKEQKQEMKDEEEKTQEKVQQKVQEKTQEKTQEKAQEKNEESYNQTNPQELQQIIQEQLKQLQQKDKQIESLTSELFELKQQLRLRDENLNSQQESHKVGDSDQKTQNNQIAKKCCQHNCTKNKSDVANDQNKKQCCQHECTNKQKQDEKSDDKQKQDKQATTTTITKLEQQKQSKQQEQLLQQLKQQQIQLTNLKNKLSKLQEEKKIFEEKNLQLEKQTKNDQRQIVQLKKKYKLQKEQLQKTIAQTIVEGQQNLEKEIKKYKQQQKKQKLDNNGIYSTPSLTKTTQQVQQKINNKQQLKQLINTINELSHLVNNNTQTNKDNLKKQSTSQTTIIKYQQQLSISQQISLIRSSVLEINKKIIKHVNEVEKDGGVKNEKQQRISIDQEVGITKQKEDNDADVVADDDDQQTYTLTLSKTMAYVVAGVLGMFLLAIFRIFCNMLFVLYDFCNKEKVIYEKK